MNDGSFPSLDAKSARIEKKVLMRNGQSYFVEWELKKNGFNANFPKRKITSIYFDDLNFTALRDNIDGNPSRDKFRIRFYNDEIAKAFIEVKSKRGYVGFKTKVPFTIEPANLDQAVKACQNWLSINYDSHYVPAAIVSYERQYFVRGEIRATMDRKVSSGRWVSSNITLSSALSALNYEVLEFKFPCELDQDFRKLFNIFKFLSIRSTKSSKYSNSLVY